MFITALITSNHEVSDTTCWEINYGTLKSSEIPNDS